MILLLVCNSDLYSQPATLSKKELRQDARQEKKIAAAEEAARQFELMKAIVSSRRFVLEADRLGDGEYEYSVQSELNYILVESLNSSVQTGSRSQSMKYQYWDYTKDDVWSNDLGGWTINGKIRNYKVKNVERRNSVIIKYDIYERIGSTSITIRVSHSGYASAMVNGVTRFYGRLVPLHESKIYRGPREL